MALQRFSTIFTDLTNYIIWKPISNLDRRVDECSANGSSSVTRNGRLIFGRRKDGAKGCTDTCR